MDIKVSKDIDEALKYLMSSDYETLNRHFKYQEVSMKSEHYNYALKYIEDEFNDLYERTRIMQDVINYAKAFITTNIHETLNECRDIYEDIQEAADGSRQQGYVTIKVPFDNLPGEFLDRDGSKLFDCSIYDRKITLSNELNKDIKMKSVSRSQGFKPYKDSLQDLLKGEPYRAFYMLENSVKDGLKEEIKIELDQNYDINLFGVQTSNAELIQVKYGLSNGKTEFVQENINGIQKTRNVKDISFMLGSDKFEKKTYYIDATRVKSSFWTTVKDMEYNSMMGISSDITAAQLDELAGLTEFKKDYEAYTKQVDDWIAKRQQVANQNKQNGYSDAVPSVSANKTSVDLDTSKYYNNPSKPVINDIGIRQPESIYPDAELVFYKKPDDKVLLDRLGKELEKF